MAVSTLVTTPGAANANSYCSLAEADQYHADRPAVGTTWEDADINEKSAALLWATKLLDSRIEWEGIASTDTQALLWPRSGLWKRNGRELVPDTAIPQELKWATAEYARQLLVSDRAADSDIETMGITALTAGPVSLSFSQGVQAKVVPDIVYSILPAGWGFIIGASRTRDLMRA